MRLIGVATVGGYLPLFFKRLREDVVWSCCRMYFFVGGFGHVNCNRGCWFSFPILVWFDFYGLFDFHDLLSTFVGL